MKYGIVVDGAGACQEGGDSGCKSKSQEALVIMNLFNILITEW